MSKLNPIEVSNYIEKEFREYLKDTFNFDDPIYKQQFNKELDKQVLYKGPYLSVSLPFKSSKSLNDLINEGKISPLFKNFSGLNLNRKLYYHQEEALEKIGDGRNVVITTGTGSGKTESFLYPILNSILREIEANNNTPGIRAILLYPMNALINDQIDRVRKILKDFPEIKYGFFTGETKEKSSQKLRNELSEDAKTEIPSNELIYREEIRNNPPHLLFTNYSMLEYLLIRPNDFKIFNQDYLKNWRYIVLDEAHTYNGAKGIEVSLLLRRATGLAPKKPNFILTSATLGEKGRDEQQIIEFAESLTSSKYYKDDIIFSKREGLNSDNIKYKVDPNIYIEIDKSVDDIEAVSEILKNYIEIDSKGIPEMLYEFLIKDSNVYFLYQTLKEQNYQFKEVMNILSDIFCDDLQLISLVHLINLAKKDYKNIYDIKYHTFIRTLSGAYITLNPNKTIKLTNCYNNENLKTFELGTCRFCGAIYIFGKEIDGYLYQNSDVDIYENYGDSKKYNIDYYLLTDNLDLRNVDIEKCQKMILCSKCGKIYNANNLNAEKCNCQDEYKIEVLKVINENFKNNISYCPCCLHHSNRDSGVVRGVNIGKDEATSILAQILYEAIDLDNVESEINNFTEVSNPFKLTEITKPKQNEKNVKQFLTFSDSRQQASFFAPFFEYNNNRFLRKKLLYEVIKNNNYNDIKFDSLISELEDIIENKNLFPSSKLTSNKQAWVTALYELLSIDGKYDAENLGLYYFTLNIDKILELFTDDQIEEEFGKYNLNRNDLSNLINVIFSIFRISSAINYKISGLSPDDRKEYLGYRRFDNYIKLKKDKKIAKNMDDEFKKDGNIKSFLPIDDTGINQVLNYVMKVCNCNRDDGIHVLEVLFNVIGKRIFTKPSYINDDIYQISASQYVLKNYKNSKYYKCNRCGGLTVYNVHDKCPVKACPGTLEECDPDLIFKNNYYRKKYINKKIERFDVVEHTAQLSKKQARKYQNDFKYKKINVLSCSTTFEMGVDLGDLETVFMRNVPPTPANYVQRAGRAGRSDDSSAFILTFCGNSSHDYTYFENPNAMISGVIKPPKFKITNEKIILRHLLATTFGFFFRRNPVYFEKIENLVCNGGITKFYEYLDSKPEDLNEFINNKVLDNEIYDKYCDYKWINLLEEDGNYIANFVNSITDLLNKFSLAREEASQKEDYENAKYYKDQIEKIKNDNVITNLTKYNIIPKYGFPVDVVDLQIWTKDGKLDEQYDSSRDLSLAISEYAPDSEVIIDKTKYTSKYITLPKTGELRKYYYFECQYCNRYNIDEIKENLTKCNYCGKESEIQNLQYFIEPIYGFKTGETKESTTKKPKKSYSGSVSYIGNGKVDTNKLILGKNNYLTIESSTDDELLVMNKNPFYMCYTCGFSKIDKPGISDTITETHNNYKGYQCKNTKLQRISLGHKFKTDVVKVRIKNLRDKKKALSFLYAFLEGISQEFSIERRDIDGLVVKNIVNCYDVIIFDNVPGGAGHVKRIMDKNMLIETINLANKKVMQNCCDEDSSCYNCLRNYNNQSYHKDLKRKYAKEVIKEIFENLEEEEKELVEEN